MIFNFFCQLELEYIKSFNDKDLTEYPCRKILAPLSLDISPCDGFPIDFEPGFGVFVLRLTEDDGILCNFQRKSQIPQLKQSSGLKQIKNMNETVPDAFVVLKYWKLETGT